MQTFPEAHGHWVRGHLREMRGNLLDLFTAARQKHGDYVRIRIAPKIYCYLLTHPDAVEHVLHKNHRNFRKPNRFYNSVGLLVGNGMFTSEGPAWQRQRQRAQPAFHRNFISRLAPTMVAAGQDFVRQRRLAGEQAFDMTREMTRLGMKIASTTLFSTDISGDADRIGRAYRVAFEYISRRLNSAQLMPHWFPTPDNLAFFRAKRTLDELVMQLIADRRARSDRPEDLLDMLMRGETSATPDPASDPQMRDEVLTLLTAGHENIGAALAWTWFLIASNQEVQSNLHAELDTQLGTRDPTFDDLDRLPLMSAVFCESLRLYPPGWGEMRQSIGDDEIAGYSLPANSMVVLCQWVTHRHPQFWPEPDRFNPGRFLGDHPDRHRFAYFPFGGGPRICIGVQFAMIEGPLVLASILQHFRVELATTDPVIPDATFTLLPKHPLWMKLRPRKSDGNSQ